MKTIHTLGSAISKSLNFGCAIHWIFAGLLICGLARPSFGQNTIDSPLTIQGGADQWLQSVINGKYYPLIGTYPGWDVNAIFLGGYNATNRSGDPVNKVIIGGPNSTLPLIVTGNVGIGTSSPRAALEVSQANGGLVIADNGSSNFLQVGGADISGGKGFVFRSTANESAVTQFSLSVTDGSAQQERLTISRTGNMSIRANNGGFSVADFGEFNFLQVGGTDANASKGFVLRSTTNNSAEKQFSLFVTDGSAQQERLTVSRVGNVLIGKTSQSNTIYKLDVNGSARFNEVVVNTSGADFVFDKGYQLMPLSAVEVFIKENGHLPEVASAKEMQENGAAVGEMQTKLLQKVEELTLHLIEMHKEIEVLKQENKTFKESNKLQK